jgi:acetyl/propionyl-CoA carboxylase alpha subunit
MFYDPMIAKLVTYAPDRDSAITAMEEALDRFQIDGIQHNMGFLSALMTHPRWKSGALTTNFIAEEFPDGFAIFDIDGDTQAIKVEPADAGWRLRQLGVDVRVQVFSPRVAELARLMPEKKAPDTSRLLLCPMPGLIVSIAVNEGDEVQEGQTLAVVEAMKMENVLKAERKGVVARVPVKAGDSLAVDEVIMEFAT